MRDEPQPSREIAATAKGASVAHSRDNGARCERSNAWHRHQLLAGIVLSGHCANLPIDVFNRVLEFVPLASELCEQSA